MVTLSDRWLHRLFLASLVGLVSWLGCLWSLLVVYTGMPWFMPFVMAGIVGIVVAPVKLWTMLEDRRRAAHDPLAEMSRRQALRDQYRRDRLSPEERARDEAFQARWQAQEAAIEAQLRQEREARRRER